MENIACSGTLILPCKAKCMRIHNTLKNVQYTSFYMILCVLILVVIPEVSISPLTVITNAYSNVTFNCIGRGFGKITVNWRRKEYLLTAKARIDTSYYDHQISSKMTISNVVELHSGEYCCSMSNDIGNSEDSCATLDVKGTKSLSSCCYTVST